MISSLRFNKILVRWQRRCPQNFCIEEDKLYEIVYISSETSCVTDDLSNLNSTLREHSGRIFGIF
jgi:hypothetical protein